MILSVVGAYYGICIDAIFLGGTPQNINLTHSRFKLICRFMIIIIIWFAPIYLSLKLSNSFMGPYSYAWEYLIRYSIPYFLFTMIMYSFSKSIMDKFGLVTLKKGTD